MIVKENGLRYAKLIHVSVDNGKTDNSNKVYIMEELSDGRIKCEYGRVGKSLTTEYKDKSKWDSVYKQKTGKSKGYTDVTELLAEPVTNSTQPNNGVDAIKDVVVKKLVIDLMTYANKSIQKNYKVTQDAVSEQQVDTAQEIITKVTGMLKLNADLKQINDELLRLYTVIPRKMDNVKNHLVNGLSSKNELEDAQRLLGDEQSALDTMAGQVKLIKQQKQTLETTGEEMSDIDILTQMGLKVEVEKDSETLKLITKLLGDNANKAKKIFKVVNLKTQGVFDKHFNSSKVKKKRLYWHGSRNENIFNIIQTGLLIRPSGVVHTGSMFGDGIYFANKSQKSLGYSSLSGSYWTRGNSNVGFLALFDVHLGNEKHIYKHDSSCYSLSYKNIQKDGFDSVYAHGGADLRNDEFIIYNPAQCTISHLIQMEN
jgi:poly [ADP-ribose] polymerase 2/3/4